MLALKKLQLYPIQEVIVDACREEMKQHKKIILQAATGLGKTIIATWMAKQAYKKNLKILFVCDRISLINQTSEVFSDYGLLHGIFQADNPNYAPDLPIQIGSIQTLARRKQRDYDFIILDEIHSFFKAHEKILSHNPDAFFLGLSATPYTKGLGKYFDKHIEPVPMRQLINDEYLCDFEIYGPDTIDLSKVRTVAGEYKPDDLSREADKPKLVADVVETWKTLSKGLKTIVFAVDVAHARHLEKEFKSHGINAREINGYMQKEGDTGANKIIQDFRDNKIKVLISVEMLTKGFDVPDVECIVFATATKSCIKWIQACGRGLRTFPGKDICRILDHGSNAERLGFPDEYEFIKLDDGKRQQPGNKDKGKPARLPKKCSSCDYLKPATMHICPACGHEPKFIQKVDTIDGELKRIKRKMRKEYSLNDKQAFLAQLNQYAHEKGFREGKKGCYGWSLHKYQEKFGTEVPRRLDWALREPIQADVRGFITHLTIKYFRGKR